LRSIKYFFWIFWISKFYMTIDARTTGLYDLKYMFGSELWIYMTRTIGLYDPRW
jgi:hypothetical protein